MLCSSSSCRLLNLVRCRNQHTFFPRLFHIGLPGHDSSVNAMAGSRISFVPRVGFVGSLLFLTSMISLDLSICCLFACVWVCEMSVLLETSLGNITVDLFTDETPRASTNFLKLCKVPYARDIRIEYLNRSIYLLLTHPDYRPTQTSRSNTTMACCSITCSVTISHPRAIPCTMALEARPSGGACERLRAASDRLVCVLNLNHISRIG